MGKQGFLKLLFAIVWVGSMTALPAYAAAPKDGAKKDAAVTVKIGVIDTARIMQESKAAKNARSIFQKEREAKQGILVAREKDVRLLDQELGSQDSKLTAEERNAKGEKLARDVKELNRLKSDLEEELKKKDVELTRKLIAELREIVNTFSKKENYTLILEANSVVTFDQAINITDTVIRIYDGDKNNR